jgi:DUF2924 family protein
VSVNGIAMTDRDLLYFEQLKSLDSTALKVAWRAIFKSAPPRAAHKEFFVRFLAHEFQVRMHGGLRKSSLKTLSESDQAKNSPAGVALAANKTLRAGTRLLRQWGGAAHEVTVMERGYAYRGRSYTSLSEIARCITGARWSGPRFFGLRHQSERAASERTA